ncbi:uncharacterized protein [Dendrobates tinctorius]|uniref:uncharacterized protein n=1 Tax=Dendrobates tinctorius TaxID=92724 RepID=UPI003CC9AF73
MSMIKPAILQFKLADKMDELLKQLILSQQRQHNHQQQELQQRQQEHQQQEQLQLLYQQQQKTNELILQQIAAVREAPSCSTMYQLEARYKVQSALRKMLPENDMEAFLTIFERTAEQKSLLVTQWAEVVSPFLTGDAQKACLDLIRDEALDYGKLKATDCRHNPLSPAIFLDFLPRTLRWCTNLELHCVTLTEYLKVQRIPRGLRVPLRPILFSDSSDFCSRFEQIINKCSFDLITLTLEHLHLGIAKCKEEISSIETQLSSSISNEDFNNLKTKINGVIEQHRRDIETRKRNKFARDTEDYKQNRVYKWRESYISGNFNFYPNYRSTTDISSSGSDHERQAPSGRFLGQRRRSTKRRGPAGGRDLHRNMDSGRITRSQEEGELTLTAPLGNQLLRSGQRDRSCSRDYETPASGVGGHTFSILEASSELLAASKMFVSELVRFRLMQLRRRQRRRISQRRYWIHELNFLRNTCGAFHTLDVQLRDHPFKFQRYLRTTFLRSNI